MANDSGFSFEPPPEPPVTTPDDANPGRYVVWGWKDLVVGFIAVVAFFLILDIAIIVPVQSATSENAPETLAAQAVTSALWDGTILLAVHWLVARKGGHWRNLGLRLPRLRLSGKAWTPNMLVGFVIGAYVLAIV